MKVLLVSLPLVSKRTDIEDMTYSETLALLYLASALRAQDIEVDVWDSIILGAIPGLKGVLYRMEVEETIIIGTRPGTILYKIEEYNPDIVGISIQFTHDHGIAMTTAQAIKAKNPNIIVVIGGPHVTLNPQECLENECVDYIVTGEGEVAFPALVKAIKSGNMDPDIPGVTSDFELIDDLDVLEMPAWDLLPMNGEFMHWCNGEGRNISMITSRGCTFDCAFCSSPLLNRRRLRMHSPGRVLAEVDWLVNEHRVEGIVFKDDNITVNLDRFHAIMEGIVKKNYGLHLSAMNFRSDMLPKETLKLMKAAGFKHVWIFPESGNQRVLDELMGKRLDLSDVHETVENVIEAELTLGIGLMIGMAGETKKEISDTVEFAQDLRDKGATRFWVSIATPIKGTRLYDECIKRGYISDLSDNLGFGLSSFDTEHWTAEELMKLRSRMMVKLDGRQYR